MTIRRSFSLLLLLFPLPLLLSLRVSEVITQRENLLGGPEKGKKRSEVPPPAPPIFFPPFSPNVKFNTSSLFLLFGRRGGEGHCCGFLSFFPFSLLFVIPHTDAEIASPPPRTCFPFLLTRTFEEEEEEEEEKEEQKEEEEEEKKKFLLLFA